MIIASIDIGTNTALLLVGSLSPDGRLEVLHDSVQAPRLGQGVDASRHLTRAAIVRVLRVLTEYRSIINGYQPARIIVTATSAVRDARNRKEFIDQVREATGFDVRVLSGEEEAAWTFAGTVSGSSQPDPSLVVDIGGGSTELSIGTGSRPSFHTSLDIGAVRLTERFFKTSPPASAEIGAAEMEISARLAAVPGELPPRCIAYGVAGTPTSLAAFLAGLRTFDRSVVDGYELSRHAVEGVFRKLSRLSPSEIRALGETFAGREDVITAGTLILMKVMDHFGLDRIRVSVRGLRYGALLAAATGEPPSGQQQISQR
jgi:exopolyphosphatase / guanosine-5'-triphosphate,3'-diphosphate pyrophosphatase